MELVIHPEDTSVKHSNNGNINKLDFNNQDINKHIIGSDTTEKILNNISENLYKQKTPEIGRDDKQNQTVVLESSKPIINYDPAYLHEDNKCRNDVNDPIISEEKEIPSISVLNENRLSVERKISAESDGKITPCSDGKSTPRHKISWGDTTPIPSMDNILISGTKVDVDHLESPRDVLNLQSQLYNWDCWPLQRELRLRKAEDEADLPGAPVDDVEKIPSPLQENGGVLVQDKKRPDPLVLPSPGSFISKSPGTAGDVISLSSLRRVASRSSILSTMDSVKDKISLSIPAEVKKKPEDRKLRVFVAILFALCFSMVVTTHVLYRQHLEKVRIFSRVRLEEDERHLLVFDQNNKLVMRADLGIKLPDDIHPYHCVPVHVSLNNTEHVTCLEWKGHTKLEVAELDNDNGVTCHRITWTSLSPLTSPIDCWPVGEGQGHWYGGGESLVSRWPLDNGHIRMSPFVTGDEDQTEWGNVIRKFFLNSKGLSITIEDETPLSVSLNDDIYPGLCLQANFDDFPYYYHRFNLPVLNYTVCTDGDLAQIHSNQLEKGFWDGHQDSDLQVLDRLLQLPLWQVPVQGDGVGYSSEGIQQYLTGLVGNSSEGVGPNEERGYLLLDHHWQQAMGDFTFSQEYFPDMKQVQNLTHNSGLRLALSINPFVSVDSVNFQEGVRLGLFVMERNTTSDRNIPALTWFKDVPVAALLDITNPATVSWLQDKLKDLSDGDASEAVFFLDTGNTFHTPHYFSFHSELHNPDLYKEHFVHHCMEMVKVIGVSGASSKRPKAPAFVWMTPMESSWSSLESIIPNILHLGVIGYPFINPGPIGGHVPNRTVLPDQELFIRWWQLATFLPQMHFLTSLSVYENQEIATVAKSLKKLKEEVVNPLLLKFGQEAMEDSMPLIRPMWMLDPNNEESQEIDDQFLIGDKLLVAPILRPGQIIRDVYLPSTREGSGVWRRNDGVWFEGGQWVKDNDIPLHDVLYFERQPQTGRPGRLE